jgi:uncharacterized protein
MKGSKYNILCTTDEGEKLAFNATTCALAVVEDRFINLLEDINNIDFDVLNEEDKSLINDMKLGNFIIDNEIDELEQLKFRNKVGKFSSSSLGLTIAPTLNCNFKCPYCYETPQTHLMSQDTQKGLLEFIDKNTRNVKRLSVTWYGGEPLIGIDIINKLSEDILKICSINHVEYSAYMVSNGYLVSESVINNMKNNMIRGCQITLDGPPEVHDKRRILRNGNGTFEIIVDNIKKLINNNINVSIRVNIDKTNVEQVEELLQILIKNNLNSLSINFGQLTAYTEACSSVSDHCLNTEEYSDEYKRMQKLLVKYGFPAKDYPNYPGIKGNYCCADQINSFVIDPDGYMYKCWNSIGNAKEAVGNVVNLKEPKSDWLMRNIEWVSTEPFEGKCLKCKFLPICMGGCPYLKREKKEPVCEKWQYGFEDLLKYMYELQKNENNLHELQEIK